MSSLAQDGFALVPSVLDAGAVAGMRTLFEGVAPEAHGLRNILRLASIAELADSAVVRSLVEPVLGPSARPVRGIFFDKMPGANWKVPWHQDLTIAVAERHEAPGFSGWSVKEGVVHVRPPAEVLEQMLTVRLHLDDCDEINGALRVIPGSHRNGKLSRVSVAALSHQSPVTCVASAGDALLMRPLLLHASSPAATPIHRRVIHLEYAAGPLQEPLRWATE